MKRVLLTGAAGFIGFHVARGLLARGDEVLGVDNLNDYYDVSLKRARLHELDDRPGFRFERLDLADDAAVAALFAAERPDTVIHLAAQPGVRYARTNPGAYVASNLVGFANVLEGCRHHPPGHLVFASSSSVYGANTHQPFSEHDRTDHPVSLYAATKKANEAMAHAYAHLYGVPTTGLRFFTVYGPWGRPDMAVFAFTRKILRGETIELFNGGDMRRDFTYIDDVTEAVLGIVDRPAAPDPSWSGEAPDTPTSRAPYRLYNVGNHRPEELMELVRLLERALGTEAVLEPRPMPAEDVQETYADIRDLQAAVPFSPSTPLSEGIARFVAWYREYSSARDDEPAPPRADGTLTR
jgi:UDP-glucuronate 4-epimerase